MATGSTNEAVPRGPEAYGTDSFWTATNATRLAVPFGETRIRAETAAFEVRASKVASPRPGGQLALDGETFIVQGEPERRDPDRLVWMLDLRLAPISAGSQKRTF